MIIDAIHAIGTEGRRVARTEFSRHAYESALYGLAARLAGAPVPSLARS